jgi:hypothetical protein
VGQWGASNSRHCLCTNVGGHAIGRLRAKILKRAIYILALLLLTIFIWGQIYSAQFLPYDENFGRLIVTFFISVALLVTGIVLLILRIEVVRRNLLLTILFLVINSPVTVVWIVLEYEAIFGSRLDPG